MAEWARVVNTTTRDYVKGFEDDCLRNRKWLALLQKRGRIKYNQGGDGIDWKVKFRRAQIEPNDGAQPVTIAQQNKWQTAFLDYRGYAVADAITKRERVKNKGTAAIVKVWDNIIPGLMEDIDDQLGDELYVDGGATGNEMRYNGIESMMAVNGTITIATTTGVATTGSAVAADLFAYPSDTYAGLSTIPGNYGGTWAGSWPVGSGDPEFDFYSPVIVNYTSSALAGSQQTWAVQCALAMRTGLIRANRNKSKAGMIDMILLDPEMYRQFLTLQESKERFTSSGTALKELGFGDVVSFDGVDVTWEYGIPGPGVNGTRATAAGYPGIGYGFNVDQMQILSCQDTLFAVDGPDYDITTRTWRMVVDHIGNLKFKSPRYFLKLGSYA